MRGEKRNTRRAPRERISLGDGRARGVLLRGARVMNGWRVRITAAPMREALCAVFSCGAQMGQADPRFGAIVPIWVDQSALLASPQKK